VEQGTLDIAGQEIAYLDSAGSGRAVIFVHGNSCSARTWLPVMTGPFGQRFRCLALDLPGHGRSAPARDQADDSLPGYAAVLTGFARALRVMDAVVVGWSLGGQITLEAVPALPDAPGFIIFGSPPVTSAAQLSEAFLPNPAASAAFSAEVSVPAAEALARSFLAPGSHLDTSGLVADILATDGAARSGLTASVGEGRFADEIAIVAGLDRPLAIMHGADEQLINLDYLRQLTIPALWRGEVQVIPGAGHALQLEAPEQLAELLTDFLTDLRG
jgi:pimeloyl-ACP methyl ester carboxylesterase